MLVVSLIALATSIIFFIMAIGLFERLEKESIITKENPNHKCKKCGTTDPTIKTWLSLNSYFGICYSVKKSYLFGLIKIRCKNLLYKNETDIGLDEIIVNGYTRAELKSLAFSDEEILRLKNEE